MYIPLDEVSIEFGTIGSIDGRLVRCCGTEAVEGACFVPRDAPDAI